MHRHWMSLVAAMVMLAGVLAACTMVITPEPATPVTGATEEQATATPAEEAPAEEAPESAAVEPLDQAQCDAIRAALAQALPVDWEMSEAPFQDEIGNRQGEACVISATGTGEEFGHFLDVAQTMRDVLADQGWQENLAYLADGPTGTAFAYEMDGQLALGQVGWEPSEDADCPEDQPISACELEPSQQLFTVTLELVQDS